VGGAVDPALSTLKEVISATRVGATGYTDVVDSQGAVLASSDTVRILTESNHGDFLANLIRDRRPTVATCHSCHKGESADKREREVVAFAPLVNAPWAVVVRQNEREALAPAKRLRERLLGIGLVLIGVALIIARATAQSVAKPIELLTGASRRIAEGNLSDPVPVVGGDEVGRLGQAFDRMRAQLKESMERIQNWNKELENRVRERTHQLEESEQNRSKLLRQVISVQEEERKRIARELHDETSQELSALVMGLEAARSGGLEDLKCGVEEAKSLAVRTLEGVHHIIFDLRPALLDDLGLQSAVRWYAEGHLEPLGMDVSLEFVGLERRLPTEVETTVFRVLQEAVNNVSAHSEAARVTLSMDFRERSIVVEIADDGRGFDPERTRGLGLMGMRERVTLLHGTFDLQSRPDKGTRIRFEVPTDVQD
jgi:signal transduction histidine kinase